MYYAHSRTLARFFGWLLCLMLGPQFEKWDVGSLRQLAFYRSQGQHGRSSYCLQEKARAWKQWQTGRPLPPLFPGPCQSSRHAPDAQRCSSLEISALRFHHTYKTTNQVEECFGSPDQVRFMHAARVASRHGVGEKAREI